MALPTYENLMHTVLSKFLDGKSYRKIDTFVTIKTLFI
ncbi:hypothetical protein Deia_00281 [Candidatus Deianiraea vastatrix]|uniref:Uncharacterized protein n=1 Tax=Candidatus Deianiraea vastatrix TaxID=2163644 RepID=A0A5B8XCL1_9RICK|nr:hypothetical protein Deia_00281 [Candidatus Deianiraea vastatrix]